MSLFDGRDYTTKAFDGFFAGTEPLSFTITCLRCNTPMESSVPWTENYVRMGRHMPDSMADIEDRKMADSADEIAQTFMREHHKTCKAILRGK